MPIDLNPVDAAQKAATVAVPWLRRKVAGFRINKPVNHELVYEKHHTVTGSYWFDFGLDLVLFNQQEDQYWPQTRPVLDPRNKTWSGSVVICDRIGVPSSIILAAVNSDIRTMVEHYGRVESITKQWISFKFDRLPDGFKALDRVAVTLVAKPGG